MGRIHDALKKAEEERKRKRAAEKQDSDVASIPEISHPEPSPEATPQAKPRQRITDTVKLPDEDLAKKPKKKKALTGYTVLKQTLNYYPHLYLWWHPPI